MHHNFCTLFDRNYLTRGLALYQSLLEHDNDFTLWILCLDDVTYSLVTQLKLDHVKLIQLNEVEDKDLLRVKMQRSIAEYCWTLTSSFTLYVLTHFPELDHITYLDADIFFFNSPQALYDEYAGYSILIVEHNYAPRFYKKVKAAGIYNVEFLIFKNNDDGLSCLRWWRERCIEWCYARLENGKFGDQMYLDEWPKRFNKVKVLQHRGGGVAPWNIENFTFHQTNTMVYVNTEPVIFYHFHALKFYTLDEYDPLIGYYYYPQTVDRLIYQPYLQSITRALRRLQQIDPTFNSGFTDSPSKLIRFKRKLLLIIMNLQPFKHLYKLWGPYR